MMKLFFICLTCFAIAQVSWETIYTSFQGNDPNDAQGWIVSNNYYDNLFTTCNGFTLFGGYNTFGKYTKVSKQFSLPPHYQLQITLEFWKIDSWDGQFIRVIIDDALWSKSYTVSEGTLLCGGHWNDAIEPITVIMDHNLESLMFIMTSNLNEQVNNESWGFRDFSIQILRCPQGCLYCQDNDYNNCYYWIGFLSLWHQSIQVDGWMKNNNIQPTTYKCVSFDLIGGYLNLAPNDKLEKIIENLNPHYKMQVQLQLWKIDEWNNEIFFLEVDDQIYNQTILGSTGIYNICGSNGLEKIINIAITLNHSQSQCKITMRTNHNPITTNAYWGIRAFNIYLAKCFNGCDQCLGPLKTECTICSSGWVFYNNLCAHPSPMLCINIRITQIKDLKSDERIPMEINLLEVSEFITTQGTFTFSINNNLQILTIRVYAKCFPNKKMKSYFLKCSTCQTSKQYQFYHYCYGAINSIIYNAKFQQTTATEQELIVNTSNTECSIYQVVKVNNEQFQIKLLEILQQDV